MQERTEHKSWLWALLLICMGLQACVEPFELKTGTDKRLLVVDGMVTNQNRPDLNKVRLSWSEPFDGERQVVLNEPVVGATVTLRDNQGKRMQLYERVREGEYVLQEDDFQVEVGKAYSIHIILPDRREYESRPELLKPVPLIQSINYEFKEFVNVEENSAGMLVEKRSVGFEVKVQVQDPEEGGNYYRWDTEGVFEYFSRVPEITPPPPGICWANVGSINTKAVTSSDRLVNGHLFEHAVVVVPGDIPTKYRVKVRQYSLTAEAYEFWRLFNEQQSSVGSIFDPPPAKIRGNLFCTTNPEEQVIGYFSASALTEDAIMIPRHLYAPFPGVPYELPFGDCRYLFLYPNVTDQRPEGF
ncbi:DUF4249 domain-containing protein [Pontibacter korlensis]|uniref:DUF4249 domain-containing protein n=1 Tax=Pontibacter korlensis TaxID=400092 RepID=A0A0E3ZD34_9BACT|nr:DUF4249 domain-containing protein [Pontibacter korlensis]AKD02950.1 hypothetical protein PKOR_07190 [Pontibacter korlensis]